MSQVFLEQLARQKTNNEWHDFRFNKIGLLFTIKVATVSTFPYKIDSPNIHHQKSRFHY